MDLEESIDGPAIAWFWPIRKEPNSDDDENDSVPLGSDKKAATDDDDSSEENDDDEEQEIEYEVKKYLLRKLKLFSKRMTYADNGQIGNAS